jgi:hypothetical protein
VAKPELRDHRKFLKLKRLLGEPTPHVIGYLECLWHRGYQTGSAYIGDDLDVEAAAEYPGEKGRFSHAAHEAGFIDQNDDGTFAIHDLFDHAPAYAKKRMGRRGNAPSGTNYPGDVSRTEAVSFRAVQELADSVPRGTQSPEPRAQSLEPRTESREPEEEATDPPAPRPRFVPPTLDEVRAFCSEHRIPIDPERFVDHYTANGWRVGKNPMRNWRAAVRNWGRNERAPPARRGPEDRDASLIRQAREAMSGGAE